MNPGNIIRKEHPRGLLLLLLGVFILFTVSSVIYTYLDIYRPLSTHYSAIVTIISDIHETLIIRTLKINTLFFSLIAAGILILGILYTHRVCGPLKRVQIFAGDVSEGKLDTRISFREKDAIHPFGDVLNDMTESHSTRIKTLASNMEDLKAAVTELRSLAEENKDMESGMNKAVEIDRSINELLSTIRL